MKKARILVSLLLVLVLVSAALAVVACTGNNDDRIELLLWGPSAEQTFLKSWADKWAKDYTDSQGNKYKVKIGIMGEGDAGTTVMNAPQDAADVFSFADDQLEKLIAAGGLASLGNIKTGAKAKRIAEANAAGSVTAATHGSGDDAELYAYPLTADNGYFLYYDSSVLSETDILKWDTIIAKAEQAGKSYCIDYGTAWYQASWFFTFGGTVSASATNFDTDEVGLKALRAAYNFSKSSAFKSMAPAEASNDLNKGDMIALISYPSLYSDITNPNIKLAPLPAITLDGTDYPMYSFLGSKLLGVNGQGKYMEASHALAEYMSGEEVQIARAKDLYSGPSNLKAAASDVAKSLPTVQALALQAAHSQPQVNLPAGFWEALPTCVNAVKFGGTDVGDYFTAEGQPIESALRELLAALKAGFKLA